MAQCHTVITHQDLHDDSEDEHIAPIPRPSQQQSRSTAEAGSNSVPTPVSSTYVVVQKGDAHHGKHLEVCEAGEERCHHCHLVDGAPRQIELLWLTMIQQDEITVCRMGQLPV
ncbi:hypothetical protein Dimus_031128 [Dionaea muscipula]